ncbi:unnamed protein product [Dracunculus medinensis]|uniref:Fatty acyl-CoA reductase n=1 Tax=Dracunculus medinensis TaxID=318479 RepID=A0A3P7Q6E7_DRAME|nr:unnamed protein product [Dracunculus medinensis]
MKGPLFSRLWAQSPSVFSKLVPVTGNLLEEGLVFHCAATVKFDEALRLSIEMNVLGTQRLIALCHMIRNLSVLVHVSTAYANCDKSSLFEQIYPPPVPPTKLFEAIDWMDDHMINAMTPFLLGNRPNTYTLTKALAEVQLAEDALQLPVIIVRPSIIGAMWRDPLPGWTDNINGPTGIFAACGKGVLTNMCGSNSSKADIIPVDIVSNLIIVAASYRLNLKCEKIPVVHCCSGTLNPIHWDHIVNFLQCFFREYPLDQCYRVPSTHFHSSRLLFLLNFYLKHMGPAYIIDFFCVLTGRKKKFTRMYGKVWRMVETLHYFTTRGWNFETNGLLEIWNSISDDDKQVFNFDVRQIDWDSYLFDYLMGIKRYILGENLEELPRARGNLIRLKMYSTLFSAIFWWSAIRLFARCVFLFLMIFFEFFVLPY